MGAAISVLIVEDEFVLGQELAVSLEELGYRVVGIAPDASEALALCAEHEPDVAVLDIVIKGNRDGVSLAAAIRQDYDCAIVFLTSQSDSRTVSRAVLTKPNGYLLKPFTPEEMNVAILSAHANFAAQSVPQADMELARASAPVSGGLTPANLNRVEQMIDKKLNTNLLVADLAALCDLSEKHFSVQFKKSTGKSPHQHVTARRIEEARRLLMETDLSVAQISDETGFSSPAYFATVFKREMAMSPAEYRSSR